MESTNTQPGFFARLKQHHLYQVTIAYALIAGFLIQLASRTLPAFGWGGAFPAVIIILLAGFPVVLVLAWMLIRPKDPAKSTSWQKLHWKLGVGVAVLVVVLVVISGIYAFRFSERHQTQLAAEQVAPVFNPPADTLVVLPFANLSGDPKQRYFSDGITEELTSALGQNPTLKVIAWDTASTFRNPNQTATAVGKALNVANVLHGSIEREGDEVRIAVELVNAVTGFELWSQHYDDSFAKIFKVQDQVSQAIASALQVKFAQADLPTGGTRNPEAHELVLKGRALMDKADAESLDAARQDFEQAVVLDPDYADAHALLASALVALTQRSDLSLKTTLPAIRAHAQKALALDPHNADALLALGVADASADPPDFVMARVEYRKALELDPSNAGAHLDYGTVLPLKPALAETQEATLLDPANAFAWGNLAEQAQDLGDWAQEIQAAEALLRLDPTDVDSAFFLAFAYQQLHQGSKMLMVFDRVQPATAVDKEQVAAGKLTYQAVQDSTLRPQALAALKNLSHQQSIQDVAGNLLQLYLALGETVSAMQRLESFCPAVPVYCNDLAINPIYQALRTDPRFQRLAQKYTTVTLE